MKFIYVCKIQTTLPIFAGRHIARDVHTLLQNKVLRIVSTQELTRKLTAIISIHSQ